MRHTANAILVIFLIQGLFANAEAQQKASPVDSTVSNVDSMAVESEETEASGRQTDIPLPPEAKWPNAWDAPSDQLENVLQVDAVDISLVIPAARPFDLGTVGQRSPFAFRGDASAQGLVSLDGMVLSNLLTGATNTTVIPFNVMESVSYSGLSELAGMGLSPAAGVLQVNTLNLDSEHPYSKVNFRVGDFGYSDLGITFGMPVSPSTRFLFSGSRQEFDTLFFGPIDERTFERRDLVDSRFFGKVTYRPNNRFELRTVTLFNKNEVESPAAQPPDLIPFMDNSMRKNSRFDQQISLRARALSRLSQDLSGRLHFSRLRQQSFGDSLLFDNKVTALTAEVENEMIFRKHRLALGAGTQLSKLNSNALTEESDALVHVFAREHIMFGQNLGFALQARLEKHSDYSAQILPSVRLNYLLGEQTAFWLGAQRSTRYPTFSERFWPSPFYTGRSDYLVPETIFGMEIGAKLQPSTAVDLEATAYSSHSRDWIADIRFITSAMEEPFGAVNMEPRTVSGLDLKAVLDYSQGGQAGIVASFLYTDKRHRERRLRVPEYSIYTYLEYGRNLFERYVFVKARLSGRFYGKRAGFVYDPGGSFPTPELRPATAIMDGKLTLLFKSATVNVSYENILDRRYELVPGFTMPPRTLRFGIEWEFWD